MGLFTKDIKTMEDLYLHVLQDIYYAENQIKKALPDMIEKATNRDLTAAFKAHLEETEKQIGRLEQAFQLLGKEPEGHGLPCHRWDHQGGQRSRWRVRQQEGPGRGPDRRGASRRALRDHPLRQLIAWSEELGREAIAKLLTTNLNEEKAADKKLTSIGEKKVNLKAAG